jgi:hypothetical protein
MPARSSKIRAVLAVAALSAVLPVQVGAAAPELELRGLARYTDSTPWDMAASKSLTVRCPVGKSVLGGFFAVSDYADTALATKSRPFTDGNGDGYTVEAQRPSADPNERWQIRATAICANRPPGHQIVHHLTSSSSTTFKTTSAVCPAGKLVVGTGAEVLNGSNQVGLVLNRPSGPRDISRASAREDATGYGGSWALASYAICANPIPGAVQESHVHPGPNRGMAYYCADDKYAISIGGGGGLIDLGPYFLATQYSSIWRSYALNMTGVPPGGMAITAICAPGTLAPDQN